MPRLRISPEEAIAQGLWPSEEVIAASEFPIPRWCYPNEDNSARVWKSVQVSYQHAKANENISSDIREIYTSIYYQEGSKNLGAQFIYDQICDIDIGICDICGDSYVFGDKFCRNNFNIKRRKIDTLNDFEKKHKEFLSNVAKENIKNAYEEKYCDVCTKITVWHSTLGCMPCHNRSDKMREASRRVGLVTGPINAKKAHENDGVRWCDICEMETMHIFGVGCMRCHNRKDFMREATAERNRYNWANDPEYRKRIASNLGKYLGVGGFLAGFGICAWCKKEKENRNSFGVCPSCMAKKVEFDCPTHGIILVDRRHSFCPVCEIEPATCSSCDRVALLFAGKCSNCYLSEISEKFDIDADTIDDYLTDIEFFTDPKDAPDICGCWGKFRKSTGDLIDVMATSNMKKEGSAAIASYITGSKVDTPKKKALREIADADDIDFAAIAETETYAEAIAIETIIALAKKPEFFRMGPGNYMFLNFLDSCYSST